MIGIKKERLVEIMQSHGVINVSYNGMPVWITGVRGDVAEVSLIGEKGSIDIPVGELTETEPLQTI